MTKMIQNVGTKRILEVVWDYNHFSIFKKQKVVL